MHAVASHGAQLHLRHVLRNLQVPRAPSEARPVAHEAHRLHTYQVALEVVRPDHGLAQKARHV
eukprot:7092815-Alexandrium_andersonii.AAC.1